MKDRDDGKVRSMSKAAIIALVFFGTISVFMGLATREGPYRYVALALVLAFVVTIGLFGLHQYWKVSKDR